mgnify:FL=1
MGTSLKQVIDYLERDRQRFRRDADTDLLLVHGAGTMRRWTLEIRLSEGGDCLHLRVPRVLELRESDHIADVALALLELHYQIKLGRFGLDPHDGEVDAEIVLPLDDATLSYRQFQRALGTLLLLVDQQAPRLEAIAADGRAPHEEDELAHFERFLADLAEASGLPVEVLRQTIIESGDWPPADEQSGDGDE